MNASSNDHEDMKELMTLKLNTIEEIRMKHKIRLNLTQISNRPGANRSGIRAIQIQRVRFSHNVITHQHRWQHQ